MQATYNNKIRWVSHINLYNCTYCTKVLTEAVVIMTALSPAKDLIFILRCQVSVYTNMFVYAYI